MWLISAATSGKLKCLKKPVLNLNLFFVLGFRCSGQLPVPLPASARCVPFLTWGTVYPLQGHRKQTITLICKPRRGKGWLGWRERERERVRKAERVSRLKSGFWFRTPLRVGNRCSRAALSPHQTTRRKSALQTASSCTSGSTGAVWVCLFTTRALYCTYQTRQTPCVCAPRSFSLPPHSGSRLSCIHAFLNIPDPNLIIIHFSFSTPSSSLSLNLHPLSDSLVVSNARSPIPSSEPTYLRYS